MIELYLVVSLMSGQLQTYKNVQDACSVVESVSSSDRVKLYKETIDRREDVKVEEGSCQPVKQFFSKK